MGNSLVPASARAARSPPNNRLPDRNNPAAPRNQMPRRGAAKESPQTASVAAAWSSIKLAAVCSLGSGTPCAAVAAKMIPLAPVSPANGGRRAGPFPQHARPLVHRSKPQSLFLRRRVSPSAVPPVAHCGAADAACKSRKVHYPFLFIFSI